MDLKQLTYQQLLILKLDIQAELKARQRPAIDPGYFEEWLWDAPDEFKNMRAAYKSFGLPVGLHEFGRIFSMHYRRVNKRVGAKITKPYQRFTYIPE